MSTRTKVALAVLLGILFFLVTQALPRDINTRAEALRVMQAKIHEDNEDYFASQLPEKNIKVEWADLSADKNLGYTIPYPLKHFVIRIDRRTNPVYRQARLTELHEECHVYDWESEQGGHGKKFDACMLMLAEKGAFRGLW